MNNNARSAVFFRDISSMDLIKPSTVRFAIFLARQGWNVAWIWGPLPLSILYKIRDNRNLSGAASYLRGGKWSEYNIWDYCPLTLLPYIRYSPMIALNNTFRMTFPPLKKVLRKRGFAKADVLFIAAPGMISAMHVIRHNLLIYHCPVPFWKYGTYPTHIMDANEELIMKAGIIIVPSQGDREDLLSNFNVDPNKVKVIHHGSDTVSLDCGNNDKREGVVYTGIPQTTDIQLLEGIAKLLEIEGISFKLIGPFEAYHTAELSNMSNVAIYGYLSREKMMDVLIGSRIGIICYKRDIAEKKYIGNTMKLYDYAAAGLPIVSVRLLGSEMEHDTYPVLYAEKEADFIKQFKRIEDNWEMYSKKSRHFAANCTWEDRGKELLAVIQEHLV